MKVLEALAVIGKVKAVKVKETSTTRGGFEGAGSEAVANLRSLWELPPRCL